MARRPTPPASSPFAKINEALALDGEELKSLMDLAREYPVRGAPLIVRDARGAEIAEVGPGLWKDQGLGDRFTGLPPMCPVTPLGLEGDRAWFINPNGQVVSLEAKSSGKGPIDFLFCGMVSYLEWAWPRWSAKTDKSDAEVRGYEADLARQDLVFAAASIPGGFDDTDRVRGRGAWQDETGGLIYHAGDRIWFHKQWRAPGAHGPWVFPSRPKLPMPWPVLEEGGTGCAADEVLEIFETWNWRRPGIDARLLLGWNCMAMIGGALGWRAMAFLTGEKGSGKSTLDEVMQVLHGKALLPSANATGPSLYQKLKHDCTPVELDELEAQAEGSMQAALKIIQLIRTASSGAKINRGSSEGVSREYSCRSAFLCSAINIPPMTGADQSRFAVLQLQPFEEGTPDPVFDRPRIGQLGQKLLRRMIDGWDRWPATLAAFRAALKAVGHDGRGADQFGALIAAEHIARSDAAPDQGALDAWAALLKPGDLAETAGKTEDWRECLLHALEVTPEALKHRTQIRSLGEALAAFRRRHDGLPDAEDACKAVGLAVTFPKSALIMKSWENAELFIPCSHPETRKLFAGTTWQGLAGATGVWFTTLQRAPPGIARVGKCGKGLDKKRHGIYINLAAAFPGGDADEEREAA